MDFSTKLKLPYLLSNQAQKHVTMNAALKALNAIVHLSVISQTQSNPPVNPSEGDRYIPGSGSGGEWSGHDRAVAAFQDGAWQFYAPQTGWVAWVEDQSALVVFDGSDWIEPGSSAAPSILGINTSADTTNRLAVSSTACLFTHDGGGHQVKINKASESDTASLVFQSNWQSHAELGLSGSNDFMLKTSPDGQSLYPTILARADGSAVGIGTWSPTAKLHVDGPIRIGCVSESELPDPGDVGAGGIVLVNDSSSEWALAFSTGAHWLCVNDLSVID